jgi:hypothetical protein
VLPADGGSRVGTWMGGWVLEVKLLAEARVRFVPLELRAGTGKGSLGCKSVVTIRGPDEDKSRE